MGGYRKGERCVKRKTWFAFALAAALLLVSLTGCGESGRSADDTVGDGTYLLTVDGYGVTEEEFLLFLSGQKAVTANYFWTNYQIQPDANFWTTPVNGETPIEYARERALKELITAKVTFILASEWDILPYQDYNGLMEEMEAENAGRVQKLESGEVFYGVSQFTPFTYYQYLNNNAGAELEYAQRKMADPTEEELAQVYKTYKEYFQLGTDYVYEAVYEDGSRENVTQNSLEVGKEDYTTELLLEEFASMECGQMLYGVNFHGRTADILLQEKTYLGYADPEDVEDSLRNLYAREKVSELIQTRAQEAQVEIDHERFDAIEMP